jgi:FixJ family two-component response regulator
MSGNDLARLELERSIAKRELPMPLNGQDAAALVYLLDDDPSVLKATGRLLRSVGWEVKTFIDPNSFLDQVRTLQPQVAVLDIWMPAMNGLEVQTQMRSISPSTRVILLTSNDDPLVRAQAMEAGASAFFQKPVDSDELLASIKSVVAGA